MLLLLHYITEGNSGLLIHCISGWDRTPLYISLLRICLWADGAIHQSLSAVQLLYFTIAYDWMLFGHNLEDRKTKGEDIFYFCFYFLKHITSDDFSVNRYVNKQFQINFKHVLCMIHYDIINRLVGTDILVRNISISFHIHSES